MKKDRKKSNTAHIRLWICAAAVPLFILGYGIYRGIYEYSYYRDHKAVQEIKLSFVSPWKQNRFEILLKVKFVSAMHNAGVIQKLPVTAENGKSFIIFRFEDNHIQITDRSAKEKILKLPDEYQAVHTEISDTA